MNTEKTASAINHEQYAIRLAEDLLREHPECAAEVIIRHYMAHAQIVLETRRLMDLNSGMESKNISLMIQENIEFIKRNHLHDFGTPLLVTDIETHETTQTTTQSI